MKNSLIGATADVVVGLQFGDEGKGKIVDDLIKRPGRYNLCLRFNGGPNAGHTVYVDGKKMDTHQVPSGALTGMKSIINANCMVDPVKLEQEIDRIEKELPGIDVYALLMVDRNASIITAEHIAEDKVKDVIGSTHCGMTPAYRSKYSGTGLKVRDVMNDMQLLGKYPVFEKVKVIDTYEYLNTMPESPCILFEGAQGFELDVNSDNYPYVTKTHCTTAFAFTTGLGPRILQEVWGAAKIYVTYVGNKQFMPDDPDLHKLQQLGQEFGVTTGRARQCNWLDLDLLVKSCIINSVDKLVINKCDILQQLGVFKLYQDEKIVEFRTWEDMRAYVKQSLSGICEVIFSYSPHKI